MLFSLSDPKYSDSYAQTMLNVKRTAIEVCYCSLLKDCWSLRSSETEPRTVRDCGRSNGMLAY